MIELVLAGYLQCKIVHRMIVEEKMHCFYQCQDSSKEYAVTDTRWCPDVLIEDRLPLPFKKQDWKGNRWTKEQFERFEQE